MELLKRYVRACLSMQSMGMRAPKEARECIRSSGAGVSHGCELSDVGAHTEAGSSARTANDLNRWVTAAVPQCETSKEINHYCACMWVWSLTPMPHKLVWRSEDGREDSVLPSYGGSGDQAFVTGTFTIQVILFSKIQKILFQNSPWNTVEEAPRTCGEVYRWELR